MAYRFRPPRWSPARRSLWLVLILAFSTTLWLQARTGQPLRALVPAGIVALELAGTPGAANKISTTLGDDGRRAALVNVALDYAFIAAYVALLVALSSRFGADGDRFARGVRTLAVAAAIVAGACDTAENAGLLAILLRRRFDFAPLTRAFAVAKFVLVSSSTSRTDRCRGRSPSRRRRRYARAGRSLRTSRCSDSCSRSSASRTARPTPART